MACSWVFTRSSKVVDAICSVPALSAAARQAGQASTSQAHSCSTRLLGFPLASSQNRQVTGSVTLLPLGLQPNIRETQADNAPLSFSECRTLHTHSRLSSVLRSNTEVHDALRASGSRQPHDCHQRRTAFGLPNLNGDPSKKYHERRLIG